MSDDGTVSKFRYLPARGSRWWTALLVGSLAINLLIGGAVAARYFTSEKHERFAGASYTQLIPRGFFSEIPRERRQVLLDILKQYRKDFRNDRDAFEAAAGKLADALEVEPYDVEKVKLVINEFASQAGKLAARGGDAALEILAQLSPEERKTLAGAIRNRANKGKKK